jgi:hypothetical protein
LEIPFTLSEKSSPLNVDPSPMPLNALSGTEQAR